MQKQCDQLYTKNDKARLGRTIRLPKILNQIKFRGLNTCVINDLLPFHFFSEFNPFSNCFGGGRRRGLDGLLTLAVSPFFSLHYRTPENLNSLSSQSDCDFLTNQRALGPARDQPFIIWGSTWRTHNLSGQRNPTLNWIHNRWIFTSLSSCSGFTVKNGQLVDTQNDVDLSNLSITKIFIRL